MRHNQRNEVKGKHGAYESLEMIRLPKLILVIISVAMLLEACMKKDSINIRREENSNVTSVMQMENITRFLTSIYQMKKNFALKFGSRNDFETVDLYESEDLKRNLRHEFLRLSEMGMIKEYSNEVDIVQSEAIISQMLLIIPVIEKIKSVSVAPNSSEKVESDYSDKIFYSFKMIDGQWKLSKVEALLLNYEISTKYDSQVVYEFISNTPFAIEERIIYEKYFNKSIDESMLGRELEKFFKLNNTLPSMVSNKMPASWNKNNAVNYALQWTDNTGSNSTSSYNNSKYKANPGVDCANFVSQCLRAGGWLYASPYININSLNVWWYNDKTTSITSDDQGSLTWVNANALCNYVCVNNSYATFTPNAQARSGTVSASDLIWMPAWGVKTHVMMVTSVTCPTPNVYVIKYSAHTSNRKNATLSTGLTDITFGHFR